MKPTRSAFGLGRLWSEPEQKFQFVQVLKRSHREETTSFSTARDLSRTPALNKVSSTACQRARPTHSGAQDRSELCVQKAVRTSEHCDITVHGGSLESSNPFNIVREEGRPMFLKEWNSCWVAQRNWRLSSRVDCHR